MLKKPEKKEPLGVIQVYFPKVKIAKLKQFADMMGLTLSSMCKIWIMKQCTYEVRGMKTRMGTEKPGSNDWDKDIEETLKMARDLWGEDND